MNSQTISIKLVVLMLLLTFSGLLANRSFAADQTSDSSNGQDIKTNEAKPSASRDVRTIRGWTVSIHRELLDQEPQLTERALTLLDQQLEEIVRVVPKNAVTELRKVPLYFSPLYPGVKPRAEYHPGAEWLRENGRDPVMVKSVEFTNVSIFEAETHRMPNFTLHELAHAYHDRALPKGFDHAEIVSAYARAKDSGSYDRVERHNGDGQPHTFERSYAMTNPMEYFAECSEAYFCRNDFYPFTRDELKRHDPEMFELLGKLWSGPQPNN